LLVFMHILTDDERIIDPKGQECTTVEAARAEARQSARDLMAQELQAGRPPPVGWHVQIADAEGGILDTISFSSLAFGHDPALASVSSLATRQLIEQVRHTIRKGREGRAAVRQSIAEAHKNLRTLVRLNEALSRRASSDN
jgi:Domain of unknown function (DUF6894)